jgi:hypothetical protein
MNYNISYYSDNGYEELKEISFDEFKILREYRDFIIFYGSLDQLFGFIKMNVFEFWKFYFDIVEKYRLKIIHFDNEMQENSSIFNLKLTNILTTFRSYQDIIKNKINNSINDNQGIIEYYEKKSSNVFDQHFSYRLFYKLRNYVQHFDIPISKVVYNSKLVESKVEYSINLFVNKDRLLQYDGWGKVKDDLLNLADEIDIKLYLNDFLYSVSLLHNFISTYYLNYFNQIESKLDSILEQCIEHNLKNYNKKSELSGLIDICQFEEETGKRERYWLPFPHLYKIRRNLGMNKFSKTGSYSTNNY